MNLHFTKKMMVEPILKDKIRRRKLVRLNLQPESVIFIPKPSNRKVKVMNLNLEIGYEQLLQLFRQLPPKQKKQFLQDIQKEVVASTEKIDLVQEPAADYTRLEMKDAAALLLNDYLHDEELTAFTALDAETFHETR